MMDKGLKNKLLTIHDTLTTTITEYYDNKIDGLELKIGDLSKRIDSQGQVITSLEEERENNLSRIGILEEQYRQLDEDFKNYQKVSIVKNLNTQLHERENELKILKKKMETLKNNSKPVSEVVEVAEVAAEVAEVAEVSEVADEVSEVSEVSEVLEVADEVSEVADEVSEEEEVDLIEKKLKPPNGTGRKAYYITDDDNHDIYEKMEDGDVGECIGKLVGKALRPHFFSKN